jgi:hypothetical protein
MAGGALVSSTTSGGSLIWSGVGWRKEHVAHRKPEMIRAELLRRGETLYGADEKDFALAGDVVDAGLVDAAVAHWRGGSSLAAGAIAGGDIAVSAAQQAAKQDFEALHGDASVQMDSRTAESWCRPCEQNLSRSLKIQQAQV